MTLAPISDREPVLGDDLGGRADGAKAQVVVTAAGSPVEVSAANYKTAPASLGATGTLFAVAADGYTLGSIQLTGTFVATVLVEESNDTTNGVDGNWVVISITAVGQTSGGGESTSGMTAVGMSEFGVSGAWVRARVSAYTSGTVVATMNLEQGSKPPARSANVGGMAAHDAAISSNPVRIAGRALNANYTAVSTGDVADLVTTLVGALVTKPFSIPDADWTAVVGSITNTTTAVTIKAAAGAGIRNYLTALTISHDLLGAGTLLSIRDGAGGSIIWRTRLQTPAAEDFQILFPTPLRSTANNLLEILTETAVTGSVFVSAQGYAAP